MKHLLRFLFGGLLGVGLLAMPAAAQTNCVPLNGLGCYYPFNETQGTTAQDATGQVGSGVVVNQTAPWQPTGGIDGNGALALTGGGRLDIPLNWPILSQFTVSFWLKPTSRYDYTQGVGDNRGWGLFLFHSGGGAYVCVGTDINQRICVYGEQMELNKWQQFTFTFNAGTGILYKNGVELGRQSGMALPYDGWQTFRLGEKLEASVDELRLYRRALSSQEA